MEITMERKFPVPVIEVDRDRDLIKPDHIERQVKRDSLLTFHSATLVTDTTITPIGPNFLTFVAERAIIVVRSTAGNLTIHVGNGRNPNMSFRIDKGTVILPMPLEAVTIETAGFSGFYDIYFISGYPDFDIVS